MPVALLAAGVATVAGCSARATDAGTPGSGVEPDLTHSVVASGLSGPWDIAFTSDGVLFFTERCRGLSVRRPDGTVTRLFGTTGAALEAPDFFCESQSGMHGVALDPDFATNRRIYVYMPSTQTTPRRNRVVRLVLDADLRTAGGRTDIVTDIPYKHVGNALDGPGAHSGGRLRFGPDRLLYVTTGDNHDATLPQSPALLGGKVLRVTTDGAAAPGNAPPAGFDRRIYTYGHRNVQGITFRPGSGQPFIAEHGPNHSDEVTPLRNGGNGGWDPKDHPALTCPDAYCGYAGTPVTMPMTDLTRFPDAMRPVWSTGAVSLGAGPAEFLAGAQWGTWNGRLAVGLMVSRRIEILDIDAAATTATSVIAGPLPSARIRALTQGPDGALYVATDAGEIWKVTARP
ncbi:MAG: PQQ-dependent sugar dehydrogenase [Gemmatimonadaceae bacterium]|nr:PQQ-dependent sugar dehydrogenase [Gemmatimonadaceae bacterium]